MLSPAKPLFVWLARSDFSERTPVVQFPADLLGTARFDRPLFAKVFRVAGNVPSVQHPGLPPGNTASDHEVLVVDVQARRTPS